MGEEMEDILATAVSAVAQTSEVRTSTGRMPHTPIQRAVSGPETACPMLSEKLST